MWWLSGWSAWQTQTGEGEGELVGAKRGRRTERERGDYYHTPYSISGSALANIFIPFPPPFSACHAGYFWVDTSRKCSPLTTGGLEKAQIINKLIKNGFGSNLKAISNTESILHESWRFYLF